MTVNNLLDLLDGKTIFEQVAIITQVLHEVGGKDHEEAAACAALYIHKKLFARGGEFIDDDEEFKRQFASIDKYAVLGHNAHFYCIRKCIEEFYFENSKAKPMQWGYWRIIYEVLTEHETWGRYFKNEFELSGCRQGSVEEDDKGTQVYKEESYWISPRICKHFGQSEEYKKMTTPKTSDKPTTRKKREKLTAREALQQAVARALRNAPPTRRTYEWVKAGVTQKLEGWTDEEVIMTFWPENPRI